MEPELYSESVLALRQVLSPCGVQTRGGGVKSSEVDDAEQIYSYHMFASSL